MLRIAIELHSFPYFTKSYVERFAFIFLRSFFTEPHWSEVLTEILLSFLTQSSHMMRQIVNMVFTIILPDITPTAFQLIVEVRSNLFQDSPFLIAIMKSIDSS